ncbi:MAG: FG-GAP-like repeat-containing protein [Pseudomonadota bacterium]
MRHLLLSVTAALAIAGCAADRQDAELSSAAKQPVATRTPLSAAVQAASHRAGFASLPDRGTLIAYPAMREKIQRGAQTYHAVELSEAHALNAAAPGRSIRIPTPNGDVLTLAYQRHEESIDGNWSWVGRTADGLDAVITFGEKAVFGRIAQRDTAPLRLTMSAGRSWLVETDPAKVFDGDNMGDGDKDDVLIPAQVAATIRAKKAAAAAAEPGTKAGPADTIDVALGYTPGLVTRLGGASPTATRLANLIAITNQAYVNSQVTPRVRLVHTLQVNYTDTNSNETALEALTGYTCTTSGCSAQTVPTELVPLRTARDTYGADLVSLIRPLQAPQHGGCGIAWLLGGGGFAIDNTDAPFGYSIVSDGSDEDETDGRTYNCRDEALAHELGHNMGQQHNVEDSGGDSGTHSYSYGYREASTTGFYTVMAYRLANSSQFSINYFGNPSVNYADTNRPTGTATANNAASLNLSMPLVAQFRNAVVPFATGARNDINGNAISDLLWFNTTTNQLAFWLMNNTTTVSTGLFTVPSIFRVVATGDLDADGRTDLIWRDTSSNTYYYWRSRGDGQFDTGLIAGVPTGWLIERVADISGDGRSDIVWYNAGAGLYAMWFMSGPGTIGQSHVFTVPSAYTIVGTGDLDGDGRSDILWNNASISQLYAWRSRGDATWDYLSLGGYAAGWQIVATGDISGDGRSDIVWENTSAGLFAHWFMNGATTTSAGAFSIGTTGRVATVGDYNGDGRADVVIRNNGTGVALWRSQGNGSYDAAASMGGAPSDWGIIP